jgi:hypothetical protein
LAGSYHPPLASINFFSTAYYQQIGRPRPLPASAGTVRLCHEFDGTLVPDADKEGTGVAGEEFNAITARAGK